MHAVSDIDIFCRVVELESFSEAGRHLRISTAVVSARIQKLEDKLGVRLLNRTTRSVGVTEAGALYYATCREVTERLRETEAHLEYMKGKPQGIIKISAPYALGRRVIAPLLAQFKAAYPYVECRLDVTDRTVNLVDDQIDLAIRQGILPDSSWIMRRLVPDHRITAASPVYLNRHSPITHPNDLKMHQCLLLRFAGYTRFHWQFQINGRVAYQTVQGDLDSSSSEILTAWAVADLGVVQQSLWSLSHALDAQQLVPILAPYEVTGLHIHALTPERKSRTLKVDLLLDYLEEHLQAHPITQRVVHYQQLGVLE